MIAREVVPVMLQLLGVFCIVMGVVFFVVAWVYTKRYLGG